MSDSEFRRAGGERYRSGQPVEQDRRLCQAIPNLEISGHKYKPGGHDQVNLVTRFEELSTLMDRDSEIAEGAA